MTREEMRAWAETQVAEWPPLTETTRARLRALLRPARTDVRRAA